MNTTAEALNEQLLPQISSSIGYVLNQFILNFQAVTMASSRQAEVEVRDRVVLQKIPEPKQKGQLTNNELTNLTEITEV